MAWLVPAPGTMTVLTGGATGSRRRAYGALGLRLGREGSELSQLAHSSRPMQKLPAGGWVGARGEVRGALALAVVPRSQTSTAFSTRDIQGSWCWLH